jgi:hypothetical protein
METIALSNKFLRAAHHMRGSVARDLHLLG